jgi:hypothetical protein
MVRLKSLAWVLAAVVAASGCSSVKKVVVKDIPLEEQERILGEYKDRIVWTRLVIADLGDAVAVPRDEKVRIVDVGMHYRGSVTIQTLKKKNKVVHGLDLDRPLNKEKIDARLADLFWFDDPTTRHVAFIRKYGKKTAKAIMEHEVFAGMTADAAEASWGPPARKQVTELQGVVNERWIYPTGAPNKTKSLDLKDGKVFRWDE